MNDIGIYESDGSIIQGPKGYADMVWDLDRIGARIFFRPENKKYIIGGVILVNMRGIGRDERIVAICEVSGVDDIGSTISDFVDAVRPQIEGLGYSIIDENFHKIKESFSAESSEEMRATLVLNTLGGDPTWIRSLKPVKVLSLISDVYKELKPILHLIDFGFLISGVRGLTDIWISSQIKYPTIDFDSNYECSDKNVLELYKAYHVLKKRGTLKDMKSREQIMESLQVEAGILTPMSLGTVLATRSREKLETFAEKDLSGLLSLLVDIEFVNNADFNWANNILGEVVKSLDEEITLEVAVKLLNKINTDKVYRYKVDFYKLLYDQISIDENIQTDFLEKNIDKINNKPLQLKLLNDYLGIHPEESDRFKKLIHSYNHNDIDGYSNIKNAAEKWNKHNTPPIEIDMGPIPGILSGKGVLVTSVILLIIAICIAVFGIPLIAPPPTPQILITNNPSNISVGEPTDLNISVKANDALLDNVTITLSGAVTSTNLTNSTGVVIIGVNATNGDSITVTANKSGYANGTGRIHVITVDAINDDNVTVTPNISGLEDQKDNVSVQSWVESIKGLISQGVEYVF